MKKALLARPSSLIVENMRRLMTALGLEPTRLASADQLVEYTGADVGCIVVSTALTSTVQEPYCEIIIKAHEAFPGKPIFVASFADIKRSKVIVDAKFKETNCGLQLISIEEAAEQTPLDHASHAILITNGEIKEEPSFLRSVARLRSILAVAV